MSAVIVIKVKAQDGRADELKQFIHEIVPDTHAFDGCQTVNLLQDMDDPATMLIYETWTSRQAYEKYFSWRQETGVVDKLVSYLSRPRCASSTSSSRGDRRAAAGAPLSPPIRTTSAGLPRYPGSAVTAFLAAAHRNVLIGATLIVTASAGRDRGGLSPRR